MQITIHRADSRGKSKQSWLDSRHTFSFADYYDTERMGFGALRVINDDVVEAGGGFPTHGHRNMEIVSIPLSGALKHRDSEGHEFVIAEQELQIMSAGTGIMHSEYNASNTEPVNFLQIWILPKVQNIRPRYEQRAFSAAERRNRFQTAVSADRREGTLWINQDAYLSLADLDPRTALRYSVRAPSNGVYCFVIEGQVAVAGEKLEPRDGIGIIDSANIAVEAATTSRILTIEVPML